MSNSYREYQLHSSHKKGFTLFELIVGSTIMLIIILGALSLYVKSNRVSVDQQQFSELQHDVRAAMFFISRDVRSTGVGVLPEIAGYFLEGKDAFGPGPEASDSIKIMGNFDDPLNLRIRQYQGGVGGGSDTAFLYDWELEKSSYECPTYYENKTFLIVSTKCPGCLTFRFVSTNSVFGCGTGTAHLNFEPGKSELNPPGGLVDTGCGADCWDDAIITICQIKQYWLDTSGSPADYPDLNLTKGADGYLGLPNTLYLTTANERGDIVHLALAKDIENLQFQYDGDMDNDGFLDGFADWDNGSWTINPYEDEVSKQTKFDRITRIHQVRIWILGKTSNPFVSVSGTPPTKIHLYRRPAIANSPLANQDDRHRRFLLESTANIRNLSLNIYNTGTR